MFYIVQTHSIKGADVGTLNIYIYVFKHRSVYYEIGYLPVIAYIYILHPCGTIDNVLVPLQRKTMPVSMMNASAPILTSDKVVLRSRASRTLRALMKNINTEI